MVESVDTSDLKSLGAIRTGSSPVLGTSKKLRLKRGFCVYDRLIICTALLK